MKKCFLYLLFFCFFAGESHARLLFTNEDSTWDGDDFIIDVNDEAVTDIDLQFGTSITARIRFDIVGDEFQVNEDLNLEGNEIQNVHIENLATAPTCDGTTVGRIYYDTTDGFTYVCNGTDFNPLENVLGTTVQFPAVQSRRTTVYTLTTTFTDITLDTTDIENNTNILEHDDVNTDRILIKETGLYQIIYSFTSGGTATSTHEAFGRVRLNDLTVLTESSSVNKNYQGEYSTTSSSFLAELNDGDFISLQLSRDATADATQGDIFLSVVKLEGLKGDPGDPGPSTDSNTFTLDNDDTGGDVQLQFGNTLGEYVKWVDADDIFELSDSLRVGGNIEITETQFTFDSDNVAGGANVSIIANQGSDNDGEIRYDATANRWQLNNDNAGFKDIHLAEVFYAYDGAGGQSVTATEATLNIDTAVINDANYALATDEVTVTDSGLYRITVGLGLTETNTAGGARTSVEVRLQENGVDIPGALADCYLRETEETSCSFVVLENIAASGVIRVRVQRTGGTTNIQTLADASRLIIERIR